MAQLTDIADTKTTLDIAKGKAPGDLGSAAHDRVARQFIRALIENPTAELAPPDDWSVMGPWAEHARVLWDEWTLQQDVNAVRHAFAVATGKDDRLGALVAGETAPSKIWWNAAELLATEFPAPRWVVDQLLPVGLTFLAGRPKVGKSWLALQVAHAVGTAGQVMNIKVTGGSVLYLALEDGPRRLRDRMVKQHMPASARVDFVTDWPSFAAQGIAELTTVIGRKRYSLVVIDTFARAIGRSDQMDQAVMTDLVGQLQRLAQSFDVAILVVDHHRKKGAFSDDPIDDIMGATGKAAVADAAIGLYREKGKQRAQLHIVGRDFEGKQLVVDFDILTCSWQLLGEAGEVMANTRKGEIIAAIKILTDLGETPTTTKICEHVYGDSRRKGHVSRDLADMLAAGLIVKAPKLGRDQPYLLAAGVHTYNGNNSNNGKYSNDSNHGNDGGAHGDY